MEFKNQPPQILFSELAISFFSCSLVSDQNDHHNDNFWSSISAYYLHLLKYFITSLTTAGKF